MALYVVCYPRFAVAQRRKIEAIRRQHDPQAALIAAHVTLMFAIEALAVDDAVAGMQNVAGATSRLDADFGAVAARQGHDGEGFYAYLLPGRGGGTLCDLHRQLYRNLLGRDADVAFEPHVTLGRAKTAAPIDALVARLGGEDLGGRAGIESLHLVVSQGGALTELARADLAG